MSIGATIPPAAIQFNLALMSGEFDEDFERVARLVLANIKQRRAMLDNLKAAKLAVSLKVGDRVTVDGLRPKYINGSVLVVTAVNRTSFVANVRGKDYRIPMACITKVES